MRTVRVKWEGPLSLDEVKDLDDEDEDCGLYQIYGRHIIFGDASLLYIGMTTSTYNRRFFSGPDPHIDWLVEEEGVSVYLGRIVEEDYEHDPPRCRIGRTFLEMLRHLQSTGIRLRIIRPTLGDTTVNGWKLWILATTAVYAKDTKVETVSGGGGQEITVSLLIVLK